MSIAETDFGMNRLTYLNDTLRNNETISCDRTLRIVNAVGDVSCGSSILVEDYMSIRQEYVESMGWLDFQTSDRDKYDSSRDSQYALRSSQYDENTLHGGMRLTRIANRDESLTWSMMDTNPRMTQSIDGKHIRRIEKAASEGGLYDLTRLVVAGDGRIATGDVRQDAQEVRNTILDMFGVGLAATQNQEGDTAWMFLTTQKMRKFLGGVGVKMHLLAEDEVTPGDLEKSLLCVVYPFDSHDILRTSNNLRDRKIFNRIENARKSITID